VLTEGEQPWNGPRQQCLIAGFDAGQTHTTCRLAEAAGGRVLAEGEGAGVSHLAAECGPERFAAALRESLVRARARLVDLRDPRAIWPLLAAVVGASGIEVGSPVQRQGRQLAMEALGLPQARVIVTGDERTALRGAFPAGPGIVVISGTGTIAVGRDGRGREHRCGGWGWLLDGAGSAMDIGRDGLALSLQMADGRLAETPLRNALWRALELDPADPQAPQRIKALVVAAGFGAACFARLAPVVNRLAEQGDQPAAEILQNNAEALARMAAAVARALVLEAPPVSAMGGAIENLAMYRSCFTEALAASLPAGRLMPARGDACDGALSMAVEVAAEVAG
jgi:phenylacetic acid degradation operon negative regulatory protein